MFSKRRLTALVFFCFIANVSAKDMANSVCDSEVFTNTYFLLESDVISGASIYFNQIFENHFNDIQPFSSTVGKRLREEVYFDTRGLILHKGNQELVFITDENLPNYRAGRERVVYRDNNDPLSKESVFEVKRYNKKATTLDKHPLLGKVKRKERPILLDKLQILGQNSVENLEEKLRVKHEELIFLISHFGIPAALVSLDNFHISNYGLPNTSILLKFEIIPDALPHLTNQERNNLNTSLCQAENEFRQRYLQLKPQGSFGYKDYLKIANNLMPSRSFFQEYPVFFKLGQIITLSLIGLLILYLLIGRHTLRKNYREIKTSNGFRKHDI